MSIIRGENITPLTDEELRDLAWARAFFNPPPQRVSDIYDDPNTKEAFFAVWDHLPRLLATVALRDEQIAAARADANRLAVALADSEVMSKARLSHLDETTADLVAARADADRLAAALEEASALILRHNHYFNEHDYESASLTHQAAIQALHAHKAVTT
jgi:hypothetical protein